MLEINFCVSSSTGPVGLKFTGPSAKLLITYIIFQFFWMYAICVCKLVNETVFSIQELSTKLAEHFVFLSVKPQPFVFILPCLLELTFSFGQRCFQMLCKFLYHLMIAFLFFFWNVCLWDSLFVSRRLALFGTIQKKKIHVFLREW